MLEGRKIQNLSPMERIIFLTFLIPFWLCGQNAFDQKPDARSLALGGSALARIDSWSNINNPAALAFLEQNFISSSHRQVLGLAALQRSTISTNFKSFGRQFGISVGYFGFEYFNQSRLMLSCGQRLSKSLSMGVRLGTEIYHIEAGSNGCLPSSEFFVFVKTASKLQYGLAVKNPFSRKLSNDLEIKPSSYSLGLLYHIKEDLSFSLEGESAWQESILFMAGLEYQIVDALYLRLGAQYQGRVNFSMGLGLVLQKLTVNLAYLQSNALGSEMCLDLSFPF